MKRNSKVTVIGLLTLGLMISLNIVRAVNNYGIPNNNLHPKVLGQMLRADGSSSSGEGGSSGGTNPKRCPPAECVGGGCGASSCEISQSIAGAGETIKTTASSGYFACCYKNSWGSWYAQTFKMADCCN